MVVPTMVFAGPSRVMSLAGGDERLLPDDDTSAYTFPGRLHEHHRLALHNVNGSSMSGVSVDPASGLFDEVWAEATWEWKDRTVGWAINRPTPAALHQLDAVAAMGIPPALGLPARSLIDAAIGTDSWGLTATWGLSSVETALETNSNMMLDLVAGFNSGTDLEIAPYFSWSHLGFVPDGAEDNAFLVGANLRKGVSWDYFNQLVVGFEYSSGTTSTAADSIDAPTSIVADAQFTMYENDMMTGDGDRGKLTYLFNLGFGIASVDDGMPSSDRQTNFGASGNRVGGGPRIEIQPSKMEVDGIAESLAVAEAAGHPLDLLDS
jgi:hypothetical protein